MGSGDLLTITFQLMGVMPLVVFALVGLCAAVRESPSWRHRRRPRVAGLLCTAGAGAFTATGVLASMDLPLPAMVMLSAALGACAGGIWLARPAGDRDDGDWGGGGRAAGRGPGGGGDGIDWDAFERELEAYAARTRVPG